MSKYIEIFKKNWTLLFAGILFIALLFKNPYSTRNLISNLEPFPDAMYYTTIPRCFIQDKGWQMCRLYENKTEHVPSAVPPAYSLTLIPGYLLNFDVRTFYFTNILIAMASLYLLYKVSKGIFKNQYITGLLLFFYVTNYFSYWYPTLAMSENLIIPVFLFSVLLLQEKFITKKSSFYAGIVSAGFYAVKYSFLPLTILFPILYLIKIFLTKNEKKTKIQQAFFLLVPAIVILLSIFGKEQAFILLNQLLNGVLDPSSAQHIKSGGGYFSTNYFFAHFMKYKDALLGRSQRFLWDNTPLTESWIALPALFGLLVNFKNKKLLLTNIWFIVAILSQLLFMSTFYSIDMRYVYHYLPILLLGFGFFLSHLEKTILKAKINFNTFILMLFFVYLITNIIRLKTAIMVNLKYSETPWWYLAQKEVDSYFENTDSNKKPYLATLTAPFFSDNYSSRNYVPLPLSTQQDFAEYFEKIWGKGDYTNLIKLYTEKLENGDEVYVTNYGVNAAGHFEDSYKEIFNNFKTTEVHTGCYNLCNIYKLSIKETNE